MNGAGIPLYYLTEARAVEKIGIPRMSEDIEYRNGDLILVFESGARKFQPNAFFSETDIVRLPVTALLAREAVCGRQSPHPEGSSC